MTPTELQAFLDAGNQKPSAIAHAAKIDLPRVVDFLNGNMEALSESEQKSLLQYAVDEDAESAVRNELNFIFDAVGEFVRHRSVAFIFEKQGEAEIGSGTLIQIADKVFVATAGHTVRPTQILEFMGENGVFVEMEVRNDGKDRRWSGKHAVPVLSYGKHSLLDVGFFEINATGLSVLQRSAIELNQISVQPIQYGRLAIVFGYPSALKKERQFSARESAMRFASMTYANCVLDPSEWPAVPEDNSEPNEDVDCFVRYSREDEMSVAPIGRFRGQSASGLPDRLPEAFGMSGGGFWQSWVPNEGHVWSPSNYQLFAVQSTWYPKGNYLRAIRIRHWLDLIAESYPDLRALINAYIETQPLT